MDKKVSKESFAAKRDWERYILASEPKLSKGCTKSTLIAYCFAMAQKGANGLGCYASDARIAKELDKGQAKLVRRKYSEIVWLPTGRTASTSTNAHALTGLPNTYSSSIPARGFAPRLVCVDW